MSPGKQSTGTPSERRTRLAYLVSHPIQYQAPMLRLLAQDPELAITVFFCSDLSLRKYIDPGFGKEMRWDIPLTEGFEHIFLPSAFGADEISFWQPLNYGLSRHLTKDRFDVLWVHGYARWTNWAAIAIAKMRGIRVLVRDEASDISAARSRPKRMAKRAFLRLLDRFTDAFLAIGALNRAYYRANGIRDDKLFLVPYAVDNAFFEKRALVAANVEELRRQHGLRDNWPVILYASKMTARKRASDLLEAYIRLSPDGTTAPDAYLLLIGDGEERPQLEQRAAQLGWQTIQFLGFKNQTELPAYYALADVFVLPSVQEPWGLVVNEAMNAGTAIIVSDQVGSGADLVRNGENGYVFKATDIAELHDALRNIIADPELRKRMGAKSLDIISNWGIEQDVEAIKQLLPHILGERSPQRAESQ